MFRASYGDSSVLKPVWFGFGSLRYSIGIRRPVVLQTQVNGLKYSEESQHLLDGQQTGGQLFVETPRIGRLFLVRAVSKSTYSVGCSIGFIVTNSYQQDYEYILPKTKASDGKKGLFCGSTLGKVTKSLLPSILFNDCEQNVFRWLLSITLMRYSP